MHVSFELINGINLGCEYVGAEDDYANALIIDIFILRLLFQWY